MLQLHGDEGPAFCAEAARRTGCRVIKAARVRSGADIQALAALPHRLPPARQPRPGQARGDGRDVRVGAGAGAPRDGPGDPERGADAGQRRRRRSPPLRPFAVDVASGVELSPGRKDPAKLQAFAEAVASRRRTRSAARDERAIEHRFGPYGGQYVPETLMPALAELERAWVEAREDAGFRAELDRAAARLRRASLAAV